MNKRYLLLLLCGMYTATSTAQIQTPPCDIQARISISICFDPPGCLILNAVIENGYPPYTYLWDTGSTNPTIAYGPTPPDVCHVVTITDSRGCYAVASDSTTWESLSSNIAHPDTFWMGGSVLDFDVSANDSTILDDFLLVQPPLHGTLTLNSDGTGQYIPNDSWCGPDYFRYTARNNCRYTHTITSVIQKENCAGIIITKSDCNEECSGKAYFYNGNTLPEPLTLQWSSGAQGMEVAQLCEGSVQVTVTDGLGNAHVYSAEVPATTLEAAIFGPALVCRNQNIGLVSQINLEGESGPLTYQWHGSGLQDQGSIQNNINVSGSYADSLYQFNLVAQSVLGCTDTVFHQTYVNPRPNIGTISNSNVYNAPDTLRLSAPVSGGIPPLTYIWTGPQGVFSDYPVLVWPDVTSAFSGQYRLKVIDQNGCFDTEFKSIIIPDSLNRTINFSTPTYPLCANSDYELQFGMVGGSWITPDAVIWTGPINFSSTEIYPVLENLHPNMSGMYRVAATYGDQVLRDSSIINVSSNTADIISTSLIPPTICSAPTDGSISFDIDAPGPFSASVTWGGSSYNFTTSPITIPNVRPSNIHTLTIRTGHPDACRIRIPLDIPYPDSISIQTTAAGCDGVGGTASLIAIPPANSMIWNVPGYPSNSDTIFQIENVPPGHYTARIYGASGCQYNNVPFTIDRFLDFDIRIDQQPDCDNSEGILSVVWDTPPASPLTYAWSNGANTATNQNLSRGWYSVTVSDDMGCSNHRNIYLPADQTCLGSISGRAFVNTDCLCAADSNFFAVPNLRVCVTSGDYTDCNYTDYTGAYILALPHTGQYELSIYDNYPYIQENCAPYAFSIGSPYAMLTGQNIFLCGESVSNAEIRGFCGTARPGFPFQTKFRVKNTGTITLDSLWVNAEISPLIEISEISPPPASFDPITNQISWQINADLTWLSYQDFVVNGITIGALGDTIVNSAEVMTNNIDVNSADNSFECYTIVTGSYDPNDKLVTPMGRGENGEILRGDSLLTYTIRFQNTGTDTAFTIVIRDTLDRSVFDVHSVQPQISSHPYRLDVEGDNILVFTFDNIMLPDSGRTQAGSQGYIIFNIELLEGLAIGTEITNTAAIYFDFNDPVITNVTINTLTPTREIPIPGPKLMLYPNPTAGEITAILGLAQSTNGLAISLYNMQGICLLEHNATNRYTPGEYAFPFNLRQWPSGVYFLQIKTEFGTISRKLILQH